MSLSNVLDLVPAAISGSSAHKTESASTTPASATPEAPASSSPRALTNRANAEHSTGPVTDAGKAKMRFNALQHGLYSETVVLPHEDQAAFHALGERLHAQYAPANPEEQQLVTLVQNTQWRLTRIAALESGILAIASAEQLDLIDHLLGPIDPLLRDTLAQSAGYRANIRTLDKLSRHESRLQRILDRSRRELDQRLTVRGYRPAMDNYSPKSSPLPASSPARSARPAPTPVPAPPAAAVGSVPSNPAPPVGSVPSVSTETPAKALPKMPKFSGPMRKQHRKEWLRKHAAQN